MARTIGPVPGVNHPSGFTTNSNEDKHKRELYATLVAIGWSADAAKAVITVGGIDKVDELVELKDKDISELCKAIRASDVPVGIPKRVRLEQLCWIARHHDRIGREISWLDVDVEWIHLFKDQMETERDHKNTEQDFPKATAAALRDPAKLKEEMLSHLDLLRTADGVKLSYVVRERLIPDDGQVFNHADSPYESYDDEMTKRYPIIAGELGFDSTQTEAQMAVLEKDGPFAAKYVRDRAVVYDLLKESFDGLDVWNHATGFKRKKDGRGAFLSIFRFLLGHDHSKSVIEKAEADIKKLSYTGEEKNWNLSKHITKFKGLVSILKNMEEKQLYRGVNDDKLVDWFLLSIKSESFEASRNAILDSNILRNDWEKAAEHMTKFLDSRPDLKRDSGPRDRKVSEATTLRGGRGDSKKSGGEGGKVRQVFSDEDVKNAMVSLRKRFHIAENQKNFFIAPSQYNPLSNLEKQAIYRLRGGKKGKKATDESVATQTSELSSLTAKVDMLTNSVAKISQVVGKRQVRTKNKGTNYNSDDDDMFVDPSDLDEDSSVKSGSSRSSKRKKSGNRDHEALSAHPSPGRQGGI